MRLGRGEVQAGGRYRSALLCDTFEAVVGALYLDSGIDAVNGLLDRGTVKVALVIPPDFSDNLLARRSTSVQVIADGSDAASGSVSCRKVRNPKLTRR